MSRFIASRRRRVSLHCFLLASAIFTGLGLLILTLRSVEPSTDFHLSIDTKNQQQNQPIDSVLTSGHGHGHGHGGTRKQCATVEEMGAIFRNGTWEEESIRVRKIIQRHFHAQGASRIRNLPPEQFCRHGFVLAKASEAGFGNEMYKILTAGALSVMLNRSLIIGQTRGKYPFGDYISYSNSAFTLKEVKHLWRQNGCLTTYKRHLDMRIDDFLKPARTDVLCSNWREWEQPIIWFQNTTNGVAAQFFLKNINIEMREVSYGLFGNPENLEKRPNVFGELMRVLISPSQSVEQAVNLVLNGQKDPDIAIHMRMLMNRSVRAVQAAINCARKAMKNMKLGYRPRLVLVSDTPSLLNDIKPGLDEFAEVLHFDYESYTGNISGKVKELPNSSFRVKDWGPAPRWVAFVDFFLASRAKYAIVSGAHRRVGTTYAQLIAALAAAQRLEEDFSTSSSLMFLSSFQSSIVEEGLGNQVGWGHMWNRFSGPLSCWNQSNQCALTPLVPPAWWDGLWQSPTPRDIHRMEAFGVLLSGLGTVEENDNHLQSFCSLKKKSAVTLTII